MPFGTPLKIEFAFGYTWQSLTPVWTDVTAYVIESKGVRIFTGKAAESDTTEAGTASFTLNNTGRRFDPSYSAGPYYGQLLPRVPVRIRGGSTPTAMFAGFVDGGWQQDYDETQRVAFVPIQCRDALMVLAGQRLPVSRWETLARNGPSKLFWYSWDAGVGVLNDRDLSQTSYQVAGAGSADFGEPVIVGGGRGRSLACNGGTRLEYGTDARVWTCDQSAPFTEDKPEVTLEFWIRKNGLNRDGLEEIFYYSPAASPDTGYIALGISPAGGLTLRRLFLTGTTEDWQSSVGQGATQTLTDGRPHHIVLRWGGVGSGGGITGDWVIDGRPEGYDTIDSVSGELLSGKSLPLDAPVTIGAPPVGPVEQVNYAAFTGFIDDIVCSQRIMTDNECLERYQAGIYGADGEDTVARMTWLAGTFWPIIGPYALTVSTGQGVVVGPYRPDSTALEYFRLLEATEDGELYASKSGALTFDLRHRRWTEARSTAVQAVFSDDGSDNKYAASGFVYDYDETGIENDVTVSSPSVASTATSTNSASIASYGARTKQISTVHSTLTAMRSQADWRLYTRGQPKLKIKSIQVKPARAPATLFPLVLSLEIGDRVQIERTPQGVGAQIVTVAHIDGIEHDITEGSWTTTYQLSQIKVQDNFASWVTTSAASVAGNGWSGTRVWGY